MRRDAARYGHTATVVDAHQGVAAGGGRIRRIAYGQRQDTSVCAEGTPDEERRDEITNCHNELLAQSKKLFLI
jgi:hypothetical protein